LPTALAWFIGGVSAIFLLGALVAPETKGGMR
jgi:hypothetical protein